VLLLICACLYWFLISLHVVGGACLFRRVFPLESPWLGFVIPTLGFLWILNFIEHSVGISSYLPLLPFTALASAWLVLDPKTKWRGLKLPTGIFLASFAFTLALRALKPNIFNVSSGVYDLPLISSFCMGHKLPPGFSWFPPYPVGQYYTFVHYSASVLIRLLNVNVGTGFNLSSALLSAWLCFVTSAIAWRVSQRSVWITIMAAVLIECAANGSSGYIWLTSKNYDPGLTADLFSGFDDANNNTNSLYKLFYNYPDLYGRRELEIPGFWSWAGTYHATNGGQFFSLFVVWCLVEVLRRRPSNWPWIGLIATPLLTVVTSAWGVPWVGVMMLAGLVVAAFGRYRPQNWRFVLGVLVGTAILMAPTLSDFLNGVIVYYHEPIRAETRTQLAEFLLWWWPIFIPTLALLFIWRKLSPAVLIVYILVPIFFIYVETYTVGVRIDMTGKIWGFLWGMAWSVLFPVVAMQRAIGFRILLGILLISNVLGFCSWATWTYRTISWNDDVLALEGTGTFHSDPIKARIFGTLSLMKGKLLLTGLPSWNCPDCPQLVSFTKNYSYEDASFYVENTFCPGYYDAAPRREKEVGDFYTGKISKPLEFLRYRNIDAVIIWPDDLIKDDVVAYLKEKLQPYYEYQDYRQGTAPNAGIFIYQPSTTFLTPSMPSASPGLVGPPAPTALQ
jgi:hypothetical protein